MPVVTQHTDQIQLDRRTLIELLTVAVVVVLEWAAPHARIQIMRDMRRKLELAAFGTSACRNVRSTNVQRESGKANIAIFR